MSGSSSHFIKDEAVPAASGLIALNRRLFGSLRLFLALLPLSVATILLASAAPSVFRWYSGAFASGGVGFTLAGLVAITSLAIVLRIAAWALFEISGMWSSQRLHQDMVRGLAGTRTTFFDENPSGRLINRLVRDFDEVRSTAIIFVGDFFNASIEVLGIGVVAAFASPWAAVLMLPLLGGFAYAQYFRSEMLNHARGLGVIATSQVLGRKNDLIEGREIFLLYGRAGHLLERMSASVRDYVRASVLTSQVEIWASFWVRVFAEAYSFGVLLLLTAALARGDVSDTLAGVIISSLFGVTASIGWLDFATSLVSRSSPHVRRVFEFVDLPAEAAEEMDAPRPSRLQTVHESGIVFEHYSMSYRSDTPVILSDFSLTLAPGSKTALVGRTGSGKTSVMQALLRMVYVRGGDIRIDGVSIFDMEVRDLRRRFGVVPQSPYLFAGTIRTNLDRLGVIPTARLEQALAAVRLNLALDHTVAEGGHNLSTGERQLVCLARVIAADRPIILMDEPTSGLDPETDARISEVLHTALEDRTVLTIAHRRDSLRAYDRIVEMT
ncbi:MAG: ABC transporter ATP-binding protein/permease [Vicinamibacterales bacterium]